MGRKDLLSDQRFADLPARVKNIDTLDAILSEWTSTQTKSGLVEACNANRVPCAPVRDVDEVVNDPHLHARGAVQRVSHPELGEVVLPTGTMRFAGAPKVTLRPSKAVGADTEAVLADLLGIDASQFAKLTSAGAI
jgi:crotonobetainyl-CoA:carnitine CoA-transferase CaiB-like acyl-CoA transferase